MQSGKWFMAMGPDGYYTQVVEGDQQALADAFAAFHWIGEIPAECAEEAAGYRTQILDEDNWRFANGEPAVFEDSYEDGWVYVFRVTC